MMSDNQKISRRQASWIFLLNMLAAGLFSLSAVSERLSSASLLLGSLLAIVLVVAYEAGLFKIFERYEQKTGNILTLQEIPVFLKLWLLLLSAVGLLWSLRFFGHVVEITIPVNYGWPVPVLFLMVALIYGAGKGIEVRGRMAEWLGWLIILPLGVLFIFGIWQIIRSGSWRNVVNEWHLFEKVVDESLILKTGCEKTAFLLLSDHPLLLWCAIRDKDRHQWLSRASWCAGTLLLLSVGIVVCLLTPEGMVAERYPFGVVLQMIRLPGNFISRYDIFFMMLWMMSYFIFAGGMLTQMLQMLKSMGSTGEKRRRKRWAFLSGIVMLSLFLGGCYAEREPQNRNYIMCMGIDVAASGTGWRISYGFPDLSALTGTDAGEAEPVKAVDAMTVAEGATRLNASSDKTTDYTQMPVILIEKALLEDDEKRTQLMKELSAEKAIRRTALVACAAETAEKVMALDDQVQGSMGVFIYELCQNNFENQGYTLSILEDFVGGRPGDQTVIPVFDIKDDRPEIIQLISYK